MLLRILIGGLVVILVLVAVKERWAHRAGLLGTCSVYAASSGGGHQEKCESGSLDGRPDLGGKGCVVQSTVGRAQYWLCPAPVASMPGGV